MEVGHHSCNNTGNYDANKERGHFCLWKIQPPKQAYKAKKKDSNDVNNKNPLSLTRELTLDVDSEIT